MRIDCVLRDDTGVTGVDREEKVRDDVVGTKENPFVVERRHVKVVSFRMAIVNTMLELVLGGMLLLVGYWWYASA